MQTRSKEPWSGPSTKAVKQPDDFESVAKRLGCDPNLKEFDKRLRKLAKPEPDAGAMKP